MEQLLKMPPLGEGDIEGVVASVAVSVGQEVSEGATLLEVETDKVVVEVPAEANGVIEAILIKEGDKVSEGVDFMRIVQAPAANEETPVRTNVADTPKEPVGESAAVEPFVLPALGEGDVEGTVASINASVGDVLDAGSTVMEVETDKVVVEVPLANGGVIEEFLVASGDKVRGGQTIGHYRLLAKENRNSEAQTNGPETVDSQQPESVTPVKPKLGQPVPISTQTAMSVSQPNADFGSTVSAGPSVRRLAREIGVDLPLVTGTGLRGRITKSDVRSFAKQKIQLSQQAVTTNVPRPLPDFSEFGQIRRETMKGIQTATADNMSHCWSQIPHAWLQEKIDVTELEAMRQKHKARVKSAGGSLTLTAIMVKALAKALQEYPVFNSAFDAETCEIVYRDYIDIGVAVDTDRGLVVPSLRSADTKSLTDIAVELGTLAQRAKDRKLGAKDLTGAGFTLSNLGGMGLSGIFPIVNWPQVAILGVAASTWEPILKDGEFVPRLMMPVTLGFDHRVINGADGARFLGLLKELLEDTFTMML